MSTRYFATWMVLVIPSAAVWMVTTALLWPPVLNPWVAIAIATVLCFATEFGIAFAIGRMDKRT